MPPPSPQPCPPNLLFKILYNNYFFKLATCINPIPKMINKYFFFENEELKLI
jgi:hypothetical protein